MSKSIYGIPTGATMRDCTCGDLIKALLLHGKRHYAAVCLDSPMVGPATRVWTPILPKPISGQSSLAKKARFDHIDRIGGKLASYPSGSKAFWSLAKGVEANFCRPTLPTLQKLDGTLTHTAADKANLLASLFVENSRLVTSNQTPPQLPPCDCKMPEIRIHQKKVLKALRNRCEIRPMVLIVFLLLSYGIVQLNFPLY